MSKQVKANRGYGVRSAFRVDVGVASLALVAAVVLSGCASSPDSRYYTLSEGAVGAVGGNGGSNVVSQAIASEIGTSAPRTTANGMQTGGQSAQPVLIEVMPVNVPSQVSRPQIVTSTRDGKIDIHDYSRWSSPLDDEIGNALSEGLTRRLGAIDVYRTPRPPGSTAYQITVNVQRFTSMPGETASIDAVWSIVRSSDQLTLTCRSSASEPIGAGFDSLAAGQRKALGRVADQIAQGVRIEVPVPVVKTATAAVPVAASQSAGKKRKTDVPNDPPVIPAPPLLSCPN